MNRHTDVRRFVNTLAVVCACTIAVPHSAQAQATGAFSRLGFDAGGMAMGNALVADVSGHTSPYYNPALAPELTGQHFGLSAAYMRLDRQLQSVQFGAPLRPRAGVAIGLIHAGVGKIDGRDNSGFHTEDLSTDEFAVFMAFGLSVSERVAVGMSLQLFRSDLLAQVDPVNTVGLDVGLVVRASEQLAVGLVVEDLLAKFDWDTSSAFGGGGKTTSDNFPRRIKLGASYADRSKRIRANVEFELAIETFETRSSNVELLSGIPYETISTRSINRTHGQVRLGAEYALTEVFSVQAGVDRLGADALTGIAPSAGFLVQQPVGNLNVRAGYAVVIEPSATGAVHVLTLRLFL